MIRRYLARRELRKWNDIAERCGLQVTYVGWAFRLPWWRRVVRESWAWLRRPRIRNVGHDDTGLYANMAWLFFRWQLRWDSESETWRRDVS